MTVTASAALAAAAGLAAACCFGTGAALQHRQAQLAPPGRGLRVGVLAYLARRRLWLAGVGLAAAAYGLQGLALAFGPLTLVAPVVAADLLFALPVAARLAGRPMRGRDWGGCALAGGGIAVFTAVSPPASGQDGAPAGAWALAFTAVIAVAAAAVAASLLTRGGLRAGLLSAAAGAVFGLTAAVTLSLVRLLRREPLAALPGHWQGWALVVLGTAGVLLSLTAYQAGPLSASLPVMDTAEPVSAVLVGTAVFGEPLAASPAGLAVQFAAAAAALAGIVVLGTSPLAGPPGRGPGEPAPAAGAAR